MNRNIPFEVPYSTENGDIGQPIAGHISKLPVIIPYTNPACRKRAGLDALIGDDLAVWDGPAAATTVYRTSR